MINELGETCTEYLNWYITGAGWENQEFMEKHMGECAAKIAEILTGGEVGTYIGVYTYDQNSDPDAPPPYLGWYVEGYYNLPIVWCDIYGESSGTCYWAEARLAKAIDKPKLWDWNSSNGIASAGQTSVAYDAVTGNGLDKDFHHDVWNDMVDKVNEIINYLGSSWTELDNEGNTYLSYEETKMNDDDRALTADRFNALRYNIGSRHRTGIDPVNAGNKVYGWYFTRLAEKINEWINTL